ncbi:MAG: pantetheine-phosphate adenylyltransferase [Nitrospinae bacterium]|nr:pantetheine-phosphate adenylyltransferase [Nitrospinota bacterium]
MSRITAVYPGTFDPVTYGHIDLMKRGTAIFSELIVAVAHNPGKNPLFSLEERVDFILQATAGIGNIKVKPLRNLLVDFARGEGARVILKGLRAVSDFDYELQMSLLNRRLADDIETVFMMPSEEYSFISSSMIKEISSLNGDVGKLVPPPVVDALKGRFSGK